MMFAEIAAESLSGGGGWAGAGLLGLVLAWLLLKHLPAKDEQMGSLLTKKDAQIAALMEKHDQQSAAKQASFDAALGRVTEHCEREMSAISTGVVAELRLLREAVTTGHPRRP